METGEIFTEPAVFENQAERFSGPHKVQKEPTIESQFKSLQPGQHLCLLYENNSDLFTNIIPFIRSGLECNNKCLYITDSFSEEQVVDTFYESGFDVKGSCSTGQFAVLNPPSVYSPDGCFNPDRTIDLLIKETNKAISQGYSALRITSDANWILQDSKDLDRLVDYESKINSIFFKRYPCIALCQYDLTKFNTETIKEIIKTHPYIIYDGEILSNCYHIPGYRASDSGDTSNEIKCWLAHLKTHRKKQLEIEKSESFYRTIFETTGTSMCILDTDGIFVLVNKFWTEKLGYSKEETEGKFHFSQVVHRDDLKMVQEYFYLRSISPQAVPPEYEVRFLDRNGNTRYMITYVQMLPGTDKRIISALDITVQKSVEQDIKTSTIPVRGVNSGVEIKGHRVVS